MPCMKWIYRENCYSMVCLGKLCYAKFPDMVCIKSVYGDKWLIRSTRVRSQESKSDCRLVDQLLTYCEWCDVSPSELLCICPRRSVQVSCSRLPEGQKGRFSSGRTVSSAFYPIQHRPADSPCAAPSRTACGMFRFRVSSDYFVTIDVLSCDCSTYLTQFLFLSFFSFSFKYK